MRIISGIHRGRRIETIKNKTLRPTMGMTREAIFNILTHGDYADLLPNAIVLDLFCGAASFSMEALSRGAQHVVCMDISNDHLAVARYNIGHINETQKATFIRADSANPPYATKSCNLVFLDPPYNANLASTALIKAIDRGWLSDDAVIVVETEERETFEAPADFIETNNRTYGKSRVRILKRIKNGQ